MIPPEQRAQLRNAILDKLCRRPAYAVPADILRNLSARTGEVEGMFEMSDVLDALAFLEGVGFVKRVRRALSGLHDWQATSEGVQYWEGLQ